VIARKMAIDATMRGSALRRRSFTRGSRPSVRSGLRALRTRSEPATGSSVAQVCRYPPEVLPSARREGGLAGCRREQRWESVPWRGSSGA
jgi:hypothetical protein